MKITIVGGTGTLGRATIPILKETFPHCDITCFSRDELKQKHLKRDFPFVKTVIGDIRDKDSLRHALDGSYAVFNFAALKHVDVCEAHQRECYKTNLLGAMHVADVCMEQRIQYCILSSTDKAVLPINAYGKAKSFAEGYYLSLNQSFIGTRFSVFRWGNVIGSRGSVVHEFAKTLKAEKKVYITDREMTRFWIKIEQAAQFMVDKFRDATPDRAMIPPMRASKVVALAEAVSHVLLMEDYEVEICGVRPGEKIHECLQSEHEKYGGCLRSDTCDQYSQEELDRLVWEVIG